MQDGRPTFSAESVQIHFVILTVAWWIGFPLLAISEWIGFPFAISKFIPTLVNSLLTLIWMPAFIVTTVFWCILLYRQWSLLQGHGARTTPGKAVGFLFIPFYSFYWYFVAYAGLATDTNNYLNKAGITSSIRMSFGLAVTDCVLSILAGTIGLVPKIGAALTIPLAIIGFILVVQQRYCVLAILKQRTERFQQEDPGDALQRA